MWASTWTRATAVAPLILGLSLLSMGCTMDPDRPAAPEFQGVVNQPPVDSPPLRLTDQHGEPFDLADLRGQVVALFWGYTSCPDICPMTMASLYHVAQGLATEERSGFRVVMVTVDPERDTRERLTDYLAAFDPEFIGLTGQPEEIAQAMSDWGVKAAREDGPGGSYTLGHPAQVFLIDRAGRWAVTSPDLGDPAPILADVRTLIALDAGLPSLAESAEGRSEPQRRSGEAPAGWLISRQDGSVAALSAAGETRLLAPWSQREPEDPVNPGAELGAPTIAHDPVRNAIWYSETHSSIRSRDMRTGQPGPALTSFADSAIPGCGVTTSGRVFSLDPKRRWLYVPTLTGQVLAYDMDTLDVRASLPVAAFPDLMLGRYRVLTADPGGMLWVLDEEGNAREYDPELARATGRVVEAEAQELLLDAGRGRLLLMEGESARAVSLDDLASVEPEMLDIADARHVAPIAVDAKTVMSER